MPTWEKLMPKQQADSPEAGSEEQRVRRTHSLIEQHVSRALGLPKGLHKVQIRPLWGRCFRVNIVVGTEAASAKIAHSYFLVTDDLGSVVASTPAIVRLYSGDDAPVPAVAAFTTAERSPRV
jgi:hypothetical protein